MSKWPIPCLLFTIIIAFSCTTRQREGAAFSKEDFVTESYLAYQDSMIQSWNMMISDDNEKLASLHSLVQELQKAEQAEEQPELEKFEERLGQLRRIRYTQKSMANMDVIEEYDFASTALVREILSAAELSTEFPENPRLQLLVDQIRMAEERVENYRADYDDLVGHYNSFLDQHRTELQLSRDSIQKKPGFQLVSIN
ncbi:hypothetical protein WBG78_14815 [Chryseolinea sp. T2]|uniref:hypothetical protein n=1 Tax=Chryseolinea sp. T2 TaxID=3129255 RepID=UPI0030788C38